MGETKELRYRKLVEDAKSHYPIYKGISEDMPRGLYWCNECEEINLWTYWQGRGNLNAEIMLVGQDWGNPWSLGCESFREKISNAGNGPIANYMEGNQNPTDKNLLELFCELHCDISKPCDKVFFTNFVLGYRNYHISGGYKSKWAENDKDCFQRLVEIVEPKVILCLGKSTFEAVLHAFGEKVSPRMRGYNAFITSEQNPKTIQLENDKPIAVFALAHCGAVGTMNRNRGCKNVVKDKLNLQKQDWRKVYTYLSKVKDE